MVSESTVATDHPKVLCASYMTDSDNTVNPKIQPVDAKKNLLLHDGNAATISVCVNGNGTVVVAPG